MESIEDAKSAIVNSFTVSLQDGKSGRGHKLLEVGKQLLVTNLMNACLYIVMGHLKKKVYQEDVKIFANPGKCLWERCEKWFDIHV
jgi:hypothetical protein